MRILIATVLLLSHFLSFGQHSYFENIVHNYLQDRYVGWGLEESDVSEWVTTDLVTSFSTDITHIYIRQVVNGIEIFGANANFAIHKGQVILHNQSFIRGVHNLINATQPKLQSHQAVENVARFLGVEDEIFLSVKSSEKANNLRVTYDPSDIALDDITSQLVYLPINKSLMLSWEVAIIDIKTKKWWQTRTDALTGMVMDVVSWTNECKWHEDDHSSHSTYFINRFEEDLPVPVLPVVTDTSYNVIPWPYSSPLDGSHVVVEAPWNEALNASPYGWHDIDGVSGADFTITRGNNVHAMEDRNGNNGVGDAPDGGGALIFDFSVDHDSLPETYTDASTTNLFYWNNIMHDVFYQYGFDEVSGNFQYNNYGHGGNANDFVIADAQDGAGSNNANFSTPPDGFKPRMQLYEWTPVPMNILEIDSPAGIARKIGAAGAEFGPQSAEVSGFVALSNPDDGCSVNNPAELSGKIALIDNGNCSYIQKVNNAQNAGAVGVIICMTNPGPPVDLTGNDPGISIPSIMISQEDCDTLKAHVSIAQVTMHIQEPVERDGCLDNGIIIHEYGHGISQRLTGGPSTSSCLYVQEQMGEGWSDWFALMLTMNPSDLAHHTRGIGNFVLGEPLNGDGIRSYPYTTDMNLNPLTYDDLPTLSFPHGVGTVWCSILWELTWGLIDQYGFDSDIYYGTGGNNIALQLVVEGLKLQPCNPGFVDGREAILQADAILFNGANDCIIWNAFAKRGLGYSADQGSPSSRSDGISAYDLPPQCNNILYIRKTSNAELVTGDTLTYTIEVSNYKDTIVNNINLTDTLQNYVQLVPGSLTHGTVSGNIITATIQTLQPGETWTCLYSVTTNNVPPSSLIFLDDVESNNSNWTVQSGQGSTMFCIDTINPFSGDSSWFIPNVSAQNTQFLISDSFLLGTSPYLTFWHAYDTEFGWDGGCIEISNDGGGTWNDVGHLMVKNGYNSSLGTSSNFDIAGRAAFSGQSSGYLDTWLDLSTYANEVILVRFLFGSDNNTYQVGWYIDDIKLMDATVIHNAVFALSTQGDSISSECLSIVTNTCSMQTYYADNDGDGFGNNATVMTSCDTVPGYTLIGGDCNDANALIHPNAFETCDGLDNNCDGSIDPNCSTPDCDANSLSINPVIDTSYHAKFDIDSDGIVDSTYNVMMHAGQNIELGPGFEVKSGGQLEVIIGDCSNN